ncbi:hypothetical protein IMZ48_37220 [Candidatus Bathyarchaeota archaeon]|nr:hypothetical protein [Candidatus Bathyarchaeota archaeon]
MLWVDFASALSPSHDWRPNTKAAHPTNLFRVSIAAMGSVVVMLEVMSVASSRGAGGW